MLHLVQTINVKTAANSLLAFTLATMLVPRAEAHALGAECRIRNDHVELEAYFSDDTPARHAKVEVKDLAGVVVAAGETDDVGRWSFALPSPGDYQVAVDAGMGHRKTLVFRVAGLVNASDQTALATSAEPSRRDFTRIPWLRVAYGFAIIAILAVALHLWQRRIRVAPPG
jgi:hypothetical protein